MTRLTCASARRGLSAYHDGELSRDRHVAVHRHLQTCESCMAEARSLDAITETVRAAASRRSEAFGSDLAGLAPGVVSRLKAEQDVSLLGSFRRLVDDTHVVWAAMGATLASTVCALVVQGILLLATQERPDSLAALLAALASSGTNQNPSNAGGGMLMPRAYTDAVMPAAIAYQGTSDEAAVTLSAVITREGTVSNVELLALDEGRRPSGDAGELLSMLDLAATARFEPARHAGNPVAVNMVWLLERTTVRGKRAVVWRKPRLAVPVRQDIPPVVPSDVAPEPPPITPSILSAIS